MNTMVSIGLLVLFGTNVLASQAVEPDERILFFRTEAVLTSSALNITVPIHAWIFEPECDSPVRGFFMNALASQLDLPPGIEQSELFKQRIAAFLVDNERNKTVSIKIAGKVYPLEKSAADGHSYTNLKIPRQDLVEYQKDGYVTFESVTPGREESVVKGEVFLVPEQGFSVISDIDDTVKVSNVLDSRRMLRTTFLEEFQVVSGMPQLYQCLHARGTTFHYVSGSPWQLYQPLLDFFQSSGLPAGSVQLKHFRLKDQSGLNFLLANQLDYKIGIITKLITSYPGRRFILIGDNGENDPEVFKVVRRTFPRQVVAICLRDVIQENQETDPQTRYKDMSQTTENFFFCLFHNPDKLAQLISFLDTLEQQVFRE